MDVIVAMDDSSDADDIFTMPVYYENCSSESANAGEGETINNALASDSEMKESSILQAIEALNRKLVDIQVTQNLLLEEVRNIKSNMNVARKTPDESSSHQIKMWLEHFPIKSCQELDQVEKLLETENSESLVNHLSLISGSNLNHVVRNTIKQVFLDNVLVHFSWTGSHGHKRSFKELRICKIICESVQKNTLGQTIDNNLSIEKPICLFLAQAKHRLESKRRRSNEDDDTCLPNFDG
ncbi:uncharacterized protein LOC113468633 isoform X2 [Diaphorina citri]|uniref:Uncharacterized protein LOC113468633 isoform X2 n=1 Tax=Diaphorina citri TaxID=121845 RepID=A0A3Q0IZ47_DIACI|nr:uncharacterized protein LOC113468633 isoform X2 [Diaphorina citri]KAI5713002.1 hypothetical protein M8J75_012940 [Diaphorina citri]